MSALQARRPSRRIVLAGLVAATAASCRPANSDSTLSDPVPARSSVLASNDGMSGNAIMQILAHPDDDLYFMNPDLDQSIDANDRLVSIYMNCGETGGLNRIPGAKTPPRPDVAGYAGARRQGLRQAYAMMATGESLAAWDCSASTLPDGTQIEIDTLRSHPGIQLVFLGVRQHFVHRGGLPQLWEDPKRVTTTLVSTGSPVRTTHPVTRASVTDALVHLLERYRPTLVRTMDPDPDLQIHDKKHRIHHDQPGYSDHPDHTATALFTFAALERYKGPGGGRHFTVSAYRGYYNERWPHNLPAQLIRRKADILNAYGGSPDLDCGFAAGCGDYDVGRNRSLRTGWLQRTSLRYPGTAPWFRTDSAGRLTAFGVLDQQAAMWRETARGSGRWGAPQLLGGGSLLPGLTASLTPDGRWQVFAVRLAGLGAKAADNRREVVMSEQRSKDGAFSAWSSLGNPEADPDRGRRVGGPVVARNADGTAQLFVRNWSKGVSTRRQSADGTWSAWADLHGADVQEGLSAVTDTAGRIHVFAAGHDAVHHWAQSGPNGTFATIATGLPAPADPPTALAAPDGSVLLVHRESGTGRPLAYRRGADGTWKDEPLGLVPRGYGPLSLLALRAGVLLATRNNDGGTSLATFGDGGTPRWSTLPGLTVGTAALALDAAGRPILARLTPDAALHTTPVPVPVRRANG